MAKLGFVVPVSRVRFPLATPLKVFNIHEIFAPVAQWIEYLASDQGVVGSNPAGRTVSKKTTLKKSAPGGFLDI